MPNYRYRNWDVSIANSRSITDKSYSEDNSNSDNDIYLSTGYTFSLPKQIIKFSVSTKIVGDTKNSTSNTPQGKGRFSQYTKEVSTSRDNNYFASLNLSYLLNAKQNIFLYFAHTFGLEDFSYDHTFSLGLGIFFQ